MNKEMQEIYDKLDEAFNHASLVLEVFEIHRRSNHFSMFRTLGEKVCQAINDVPQQIVRESVDIYDALEGKKPHPNYFIAICMNKWEKFKTDPKEEENWGTFI